MKGNRFIVLAYNCYKRRRPVYFGRVGKCIAFGENRLAQQKRYLIQSLSHCNSV